MISQWGLPLGVSKPIVIDHLSIFLLYQAVISILNPDWISKGSYNHRVDNNGMNKIMASNYVHYHDYLGVEE